MQKTNAYKTLEKYLRLHFKQFIIWLNFSSNLKSMMCFVMKLLKEILLLKKQSMEP